VNFSDIPITALYDSCGVVNDGLEDELDGIMQQEKLSSLERKSPLVVAQFFDDHRNQSKQEPSITSETFVIEKIDECVCTAISRSTPEECLSTNVNT